MVKFAIIIIPDLCILTNISILRYFKRTYALISANSYIYRQYIYRILDHLLHSPVLRLF